MNKQIRDLYYYIGRDEEHNYVATPLSNMIIAGVTGAGKSTLLNNILIKLIQESNPNEIDLRLYDLKGSEFLFWQTSIPEGKNLPYVSKMVCEASSNACMTLVEDMEYLVKYINHSYEALDYYLAEQQEEGNFNAEKPKRKSKILVINEYQCITEYGSHDIQNRFLDALSHVLEQGEYVDVYVILVSQSHHNVLPDDIVEKFTTRVCTPLYESMDGLSNLYLGCNLASKEQMRYGVAWVKYKKKMPQRLFVPFYPDTWIRKFIRTYSVHNKQEN